MKKVFPEYSAVAPQGRPSKSIRLAINILTYVNVQSLIEVGCGLLANTKYLLESFKWVILVDTEIQFKRIYPQLAKLRRRYSSYYGFLSSTEFRKSSLNFDGAVVINVLHVLPSQEERIDLLKYVYQNLKDGGIIYVDSPYKNAYYKNMPKNAQKYNDGWLVDRGRYYTFYKYDLSTKEISNYLMSTGFNILMYPKLPRRSIVVAEKPGKRA